MLEWVHFSYPGMPVSRLFNANLLHTRDSVIHSAAALSPGALPPLCLSLTLTHIAMHLDDHVELFMGRQKSSRF